MYLTGLGAVWVGVSRVRGDAGGDVEAFGGDVGGVLVLAACGGRVGQVGDRRGLAVPGLGASSSAHEDPDLWPDHAKGLRFNCPHLTHSGSHWQKPWENAVERLTLAGADLSGLTVAEMARPAHHLVR